MPKTMHSGKRNEADPSFLAECLSRFPVFSAAPRTALCRIAETGGVKRISVHAGECIDREEHAIFCILSGCCAVYSRNEERPVLFRYLKPGDVFGIASVYSDEPKISRVEPRQDTGLLVVSRRAIGMLLDTEPLFREAFIAFLSDRIRFLNLRLTCVSAGSAERKLGLYLCSVCAGDRFDLPVSMSDLANLLDLGRASLYRAFDKLISLGYIRRDGAHIELTDRHALLTATY